ncbi:TSC22 domain family protein 1 [Camelus dromedarius]|uniref:TSC22 domain family protein 1 n=1 Tax=Camelus dromedarius TaxID=9838 RepID=A0A5N4D920_CAMDR|nr:TSC22 domain family protein 1 [Camelus dromedarius]
MHQPPESTAAAAAAAADISARKMAHPAMFPRRGSGSGSASALSAAGSAAGTASCARRNSDEKEKWLPDNQRDPRSDLRQHQLEQQHRRGHREL